MIIFNFDSKLYTPPTGNNIVFEESNNLKNILLDSKTIITNLTSNYLDTKTKVSTLLNNLVDTNTFIYIKVLVDSKTIVASLLNSYLDTKTILANLLNNKLDTRTYITLLIRLLHDTKVVLNTLIVNLVDTRINLLLIQLFKLRALFYLKGSKSGTVTKTSIPADVGLKPALNHYSMRTQEHGTVFNKTPDVHTLSGVYTISDISGAPKNHYFEGLVNNTTITSEFFEVLDNSSSLTGSINISNLTNNHSTFRMIPAEIKMEDF